MSDRVGQRLGNYQLLHLIGQGSFAEVYLGEHMHLNTQAAIKVLHTRLTDEESEKLRSEARLMARLAHPHIIRVLEFGVEDSTPFLIMEYAPNGTLRQRHPKGTKVPLDIVASYVKQIAGALQYIHTQKLIHRDVKPESMVLGRTNEVLLSDFGIAIIVQSTRSQQIQQTQEAATSVAYMAPELLRGKPRPASDQYALAVMTYEWLSGEPPFTGSVQQIANQHLSVTPPPLHTKMPEISPAVEQVIMKALDKDPHKRFAQIADFALALEEALDAETAGRTLFVPASGRTAEREQNTSASRNPPTGTVTLLFTDIEESTHLLEESRDRYDSLLAEYRQLMQASFQEWNGYEIDSRGDVFSVAFARATNAVLAAVEVQRALTSHPWPQGVAVRVRMGLHTGEPTLTSEGYVGLDVHRAERIMRAGHGGQVLLSQTTAHLVEQDLPDDVNLRDLGEYRLKDLGHPKRLFQLVIAGLPVDFPPLQTLDSYPHNLPLQLTPFIGREQEVRAVCDLLLREDVHLLALTGPGGTGKTRLALQVAAELSDRFADGVFFVNLAPISDPKLVLSTIVETLGIREGVEQSPLGRLKGHLHLKQTLLVLDNFEQVVTAAAQVVELLVACPQLKVMLTSREVPHVRAKHEFTVPPLPLPDLKHLPDLATLSHFSAVALFIARAQAVKPDFQMTAANAHAIAEICARLDGLPLAIELAAARIKLLSPQALLARLTQRLGVLTSTDLDVPERQQTLRNTIAWSYQLLDAQEQQLFRRLSIFVDGCTLEAIEAVCVAPGDDVDHVLDRVESLIDKSLLQQIERDAEEPLFVMLETIREYGLDRLREGREALASQRAHALYYLALAEEAEQHLKGAQQIRWGKRLEQELGNMRTAMTWLIKGQEGELALRLGGALSLFWYRRGYWSEGWHWLEAALELPQSQGCTVSRAEVLLSAADFATYCGGKSRAYALLEESVTISRELGDKRGLATSLGGFGSLQNEAEVACSLFDESLTLARDVGDRWILANALANLGVFMQEQGDLKQARLYLEESVMLYRALKDQHALSYSLCKLVEVALSESQVMQAATLAQENLALARELNNGPDVTRVLYWAAVTQALQGDTGQAAGLLEECLAQAREQDDKSQISSALLLLGRIVLYQGNLLRAEMCLQESLTLSREFCIESHMGVALSLLGEIKLLQGSLTQARDLCIEAVSLSWEREQWYSLGVSLIALAKVTAADGKPEQTARLFGVAEPCLNPRTDLDPFERKEYERAVEGTRVQLGETVFAALWAEGKVMTLEQVLALLQQGLVPTTNPTEASSTLPGKAATPYPNDLTNREMDVLRLLAQGLTSAQIAEQLVIGQVTVNSHVRSIYSKLGVTSRAAATRYALEQRLV